ncbi:hypothetical protein ACFV24_05145 [Nocardia fluminea]|uniref:hypothetical protein n=1 Tax=Nocardia fluminea TaxID=134984 RepID=UPI0033E2F9AC
MNSLNWFNGDRMENVAIIAVVYIMLSPIVTACAAFLIRRGERNQQRDREDPRIWEFSSRTL